MLKKLNIFLLTFILVLASTVGVNNIEAVTQKQLKVSFIDVGQGDSELIQSPNGKTMLIDAGTNDTGINVINYLKQHKIKKIDVLVATHPHEDHIGGMDNVIEDFNVGKIYMPKVTTTTKSFKDVLNAIKKKGLKITIPAAGSSISFDNSVKTQVLAPNSSKYENLNNYSIVIKMTYGEKSFLFEGDAQAESEAEMIKKGYNLRSDVLKVGHHGSESSTSPNFLKKVSPKYAVISCGKNNDYGHPHKITLQKLTAAKVQIFRTDLQGTIVITSDGNTIKVNKKASAIKINAPPAKSSSYKRTNKNATQAKVSNNQNITVYITKTGKCYHRAGCSGLKRSCIPITLKDAKARGYKACPNCRPPQ